MTVEEPIETPYTLPFERVSSDDLPRVGGKGANLGALTRAGIPVPPGFCVTTAAFDRVMAGLADADALFARLDALDGQDAGAARDAAERMRAALDAVPLPDDVAKAVVVSWKTLGVEYPLAVRSSATAEDLPGASFAGQQDTYLNIQGEEALLDAVRRCFVSLFTDRAVLYRARNRFGHRSVRLSVVVQRLVDPEVSGILFTADPVSGHRGVASIDAGFGLGEALVGGLISADLYRVDRKSRTVLEARPGDKAFAIRSVPGGGTRHEPLTGAQRTARSLDDAQVIALTDLGGRIEAQYGGIPQDIEWCIAAGEIFVVQARPITSLFPTPRGHATGEGLRIYVSFGHIQMMTEAMPRIAREVWALVMPAGKGRAPGLDERPSLSPIMLEAANRIYLDATVALRIPRARRAVLGVLAHVYEDLARGAAMLAAKPEFHGPRGSVPRFLAAVAKTIGPVIGRFPAVLMFYNPEKGAARANTAFDRFSQEAQARIRSASTPSARIRQSAVEINALFSLLRPHLARLMGGIVAHRLLERAARGRWADGVRDDVDRLRRGLPGNVTTEMDLAVGDLADLVRPHPELATLLSDVPWPATASRWNDVPGGPEFAAALDRFLVRYGDRGVGEIDLSRPRWRDDPTMLFRVIAGGMSKPHEPGAHRRHHAAQMAEGEEAARRLIDAARRGAFGAVRGWWIRRLCRVARSGMGLREHPKFSIIRALGLVRGEVITAGQALVAQGRIVELSHVWHLGFDELADALDDPSRDLRVELASREEVFRRDKTRRPPPVISSEGESPALPIDRKDLPPNALAGTAASSGVVEGIARVVRDPDREVLLAGEILVAPYTDPGWTPLFVHAAAVVTEVGGLMTHGAVVAREYGLPAVVSVANATELIRTGQRIRVDGTRGFVEILEDAP